MKQVYLKTAKGTDEIKTRAGGLAPRVRQALIFVDGRRSTDDLFAMLKTDDLAQTLAQLVEQGYIELTMIESAAPEPARPVAAAAATVALSEKDAAIARQKAIEKEERESLELEEREARELARNFMSKM